MVCRKQHFINWKREFQLFLVWFSIMVVARFTFFPFSKLNGKVQPLILDISNIFPFRLNLIPFLFLFDYPNPQEALLNFICNTAMFLPIGMIWPSVYRELNTHKKVIAVGIGFSLFIEILQLPFFSGYRILMI